MSDFLQNTPDLALLMFNIGTVLLIFFLNNFKISEFFEIEF